MSPPNSSSSGRHVVKAWRHDRRHGALSGDSDVIYDAITSERVFYRWNRTERTYLVPLHRFDDVLDAISAAGHGVDYREPLW